MFQLGLVEKLVICGVAVLAVIGGYLAWAEHQKGIGASSERAKQEKANAEFQVRANRGAVAFDVCDRADGLYDFRKSTCKLP